MSVKSTNWLSKEEAIKLYAQNTKNLLLKWFEEQKENIEKEAKDMSDSELEDLLEEQSEELGDKFTNYAIRGI